MKSRLSTEIRRCRPLLGTFVDISCQGSPGAINRAFAAIEKVHRLMSFHDLRSDVARMNRDALREPVKVHPWTWRVLKFAQQLSFRSAGVFDITVGRELAKWGYLPRLDKQVGHGGNWQDVILEDGCSIRFRCPVIVDLGGIAKGFAVDRAVDALKENGIRCGIVNAGGDLKTFGPASQLVHLRHPADPTRAAGAVRLRERAMATSGIYFQRRSYRGDYVAPLLDGRTRQSGRELISVSVAAAECTTADALSKIVFLLREKAANLLSQYQADALLLEHNGTPSWMFHPSCDTLDRTRFD